MHTSSSSTVPEIWFGRSAWAAPTTTTRSASGWIRAATSTAPVASPLAPTSTPAPIQPGSPVSAGRTSTSRSLIPTGITFGPAAWAAPPAKTPADWPSIPPATSTPPAASGATLILIPGRAPTFSPRPGTAMPSSRSSTPTETTSGPTGWAAPVPIRAIESRWMPRAMSAWPDSSKAPPTSTQAPTRST